jgi:hypothetical protein
MFANLAREKLLMVVISGADGMAAYPPLLARDIRVKSVAAPTVQAAAAYAIAKCSGSREGSFHGSTNMPLVAGEWITPNSDDTAPHSRKQALRQ